MELGKMPLDEVKNVDLSLPIEPAWNQNILPGKKTIPKVHVGLNKWGRKEWIGKLYPRGTKDAHFLDEYQKHYNSIELIATHYKFYKAEDIHKWKGKVPGDFVFCPKTYQGITHAGNLKDKQFLTDVFFGSLKEFGNNLGPILFQVSDKFGTKRKEELFTYLTSLPKEFVYFLEIRQTDWFALPEFDELLFQLKKLGIGLVINDNISRRNFVHMHLTAPKAYIRFVSTDREEADYPRLDAWVIRISNWINNGLDELNFFIEGNVYSPETSKYFIERLNKYCGLHINEIKLISNQ